MNKQPISLSSNTPQAFIPSFLLAHFTLWWVTSFDLLRGIHLAVFQHLKRQSAELVWHNFGCQMARPPELQGSDLTRLTRAVILTTYQIFHMQTIVAVTARAIICNYENVSLTAALFAPLLLPGCSARFLCFPFSWSDCFQLVPCASCPFPFQLCKRLWGEA